MFGSFLTPSAEQPVGTLDLGGPTEQG